jgi:WD40 repeat protein
LSNNNKHFKHLFELQNFQADFQQIWVAKISPDGKYLATGGKTGVLKIFQILNINLDNYNDSYSLKDILPYLNFMKEHPIRVYNDHSNDIIDICWSPRVIK